MTIETITVIGAGATARAITCSALLAGYRVVLEDVLPERLASAVDEVRSCIERATESGSVAESASRVLARLGTASSVDLACREAQLVIDTLPDEMEMKIDVFCILEKFARPGAILATNARSISVTEIAAVTTRGERCIGLRFAPGAEGARPRLEIIRGAQTAGETAGACREFARRITCEVIELQEADGTARPA